MPCIDKIAADILNSCDTIPRSGFETIAWVINREDIDTVTHDSTHNTLVEAITKVSGTRAYTVTAVKKEMNAGFDLATGDDIPDTYLNYFSFKPYEKTAEAITNLDSMNDLVIIAELKGSKTEGCFVIYGLEKGLFKNAGTQRQNDSNGLPIYEMQSQEGQGERYSRFVFWDTDYSTSKAAIESLANIYGPELLTNGDFANWTADNPDNWTVTGEVGSDPEVSEVGPTEGHGGVGTGACNLYTSTGTAIQLAQAAIFSIGTNYRVIIPVTAFVAGSGQFSDGVTSYTPTMTTVDSHIYDITAAGTEFILKRGTVALCDLTFDDVSAKEIL